MRALAERTVRGGAARGLVDYQARLAALLDQWIRMERGRRRLICMACAAELGVLSWHHLELGHHTLRHEKDRTLSALYWALARRLRPMMTSLQSVKISALGMSRANVAIAGACADCCALERDCRRLYPHDCLEPREHDDDCLPLPDENARFRCSKCNTSWVRRVLPFEHFVVWAITPA